jgi:hypothetical protein
MKYSVCTNRQQLTNVNDNWSKSGGLFTMRKVIWADNHH